jgi:hypothetical protein
MRRSALLATLLPRMMATASLPVFLMTAGCSGLGHFVADTETLPGQNPNAATGVSENVQRAHGHEPVTEAMLPEPGNVWPGPPQPLPTLGDVAHGSLGGDVLGGGGATLPRGGSMSLGQQNAIQGGVPLDHDFSGGGLSESVPDPATRFRHSAAPAPGGTGTGAASTGGNIVIPNGDGTSTVISPDGSVKTIKGTP